MVPGSTSYLVGKRAFDLAVCLLLLPVILPLLLLCAIAIIIDSPTAPLYIAQERTGKDGRPFRMYKFRTMVPDAEAMKAALAHLNELSWPDFKITNDPRITRVGRFLRQTSLDELPQLINVVKGDMSLVGPRPTSFAPSTYSVWHTVRLEVKPGITGLWQIRGRNSTEFDERLRLDIEYIRHRSFALDLKILLQTVPVVLRRSGA
ncbi:MAG TPA: sugar transferase [Gaiellaceae bacterium]|jgi:lipopolysaccharide/colanic/teichoic acid biosynthesis glycosyltransferase|nr:sugar transferase [Gaiellaceae bacterium]